MKKAPSILLITIFLLAGQRTSGQELYSHRVESTTAIQGADSGNNCVSMFDLCNVWVNDDNNYDEAYDTLRKYLVMCPDTQSAMLGLVDLSECIGSAKQTQTDSGRLDLRNWLMSVRNISNLSGWYCQCVWMMGATYTDIRAGLAILKFLEQDSRCARNDSIYVHEFSSDRSAQFLEWTDTAKNDSIQYFDTTLPSLTMLGLDSLLIDETTNGVRPNAPEIISFISASPNPVNNGTVITFGMNQEAYVKLDLFDVLGKLTSPVGFESVLPPGTHSVPLSLAGLPSGTYYARIITAYGEVQTVKMVKE
jgi:hypothetical protein